MYRRTLAASWAAQPGEPRADECIEDIFAGGDGWAGQPTSKTEHGRSVTRAHSRPNGRDDSDDESGSLAHDSSASNLSSMFGRGGGEKWSPRKKHLQKSMAHHEMGESLRNKSSIGTLKPGGVSGRTSLEQQVRKIERASGSRAGEKSEKHEIDEFNNPYKDDLRSWRIRTDVA